MSQADPPVPAVPTRSELVARVRELLEQDSGNMRMDHPHVRERLSSRRLSLRQVLDTIENGDAIDGPVLDEWGDWRIKFKWSSGGRRVQVVVAVPARQRHFTVVTVI